MRTASFCLLFIAAALPGAATTVQATIYNTWTSYVLGTTTFVDLEGLPVGTGYSTSAGVTQNGYQFTGPDGSGWSLGVQTFGNKTGLYSASDGAGEIEVTLPGSGQSAIYFDANTESNNTVTNGGLTLTLSDGEAFNIGSGQFGLSISHPITWYTLTSSSGQAAFLQWAYFGTSNLTPDGTGGTGGTGGSEPGQAPEAATLALVGGGALVLFGAKRKFGNFNRFAF